VGHIGAYLPGRAGGGRCDTPGRPNANRFGLICSYRDADDFFFFIISSDGYYALGRIENGSARLLGQEMMAYSTAIAQGTRTNHLRLECVDQTLRDP